ncbi:MAG: endonuclease III [Phycisphaeraceae bacterium]|nr:endonuclease III [Phycisphaeraceae bacterium]
MPDSTPKSSRKKLPRTTAAAREKADRIYRELEALYPDATCALKHRGPFQLLIATILSAQCTDVRVNMVTPALFRRFPTPRRMADAGRDELEELVRTTGFFRNKAKSIKGASTRITDLHGGRVPKAMDELLQLPGVARKTANVVLGNAFGINEGVVVDTHVGRLSRRLGLTRQKDPVRIERDLMVRFDASRWTMLAHLLIYHGRQVCAARKPKCEDCALAELCPKVGV